MTSARTNATGVSRMPFLFEIGKRCSAPGWSGNLGVLLALIGRLTGLVSAPMSELEGRVVNMMMMIRYSGDVQVYFMVYDDVKLTSLLAMR